MIVLQAFLRGAIVIAIAGLLSVILRNRSAALRHHIWATAIVVQLALLAFIPILPSINLPIIPDVTAFIAAPPALQEAPEPQTATADQQAPTAVVQGTTTASTPAVANSPTRPLARSQ